MADDLWKSINNILGYGDPREERANAWKQLESATQNQETPLIEGIQPQSLDEITAPQRSPFARDPGEIQSIIQQRPQGFRDVILNPATFSITDSPFSLGGSRIEEFLQYDPFLQSTGTAQNSFTSWRTVEVPLIGNFLKFDYMPVRRNYYDVTWAGTNYVTGDNQTNTKIPDQTSVGFKDGRDSASMILLQFNDNNSTVHVAKQGEVFKLPFTSVIVHFKTTSPRFRLTAGYNSEIIHSPDNAIMSSQLHMAGGQGMFPQMHWHPVPFSIDPISHDNNSTDISVASGASRTDTLIDQTNTTNTNDTIGNIGNGGIAWGWITGINGFAYGGNAAALWKFQLFAGVRSVWKRVEGHPNTGSAYGSFHENFSVPIRFFLRPGEKLTMKIYNGGGALGGYQYNIQGYTMGALRAVTDPANATIQQTPPYFLPTFTENPWPGDRGGSLQAESQPAENFVATKMDTP